jgi:hypothetical protein
MASTDVGAWTASGLVTPASSSRSRAPVGVRVRALGETHRAPDPPVQSQWVRTHPLSLAGSRSLAGPVTNARRQRITGIVVPDGPAWRPGGSVVRIPATG